MQFTYPFLSSVTPSCSYPTWLPQLQCSYFEGLCEILIYNSQGHLRVLWDSKSEETSKICVWPLKIIIVGYQRDLKAYFNVVAKWPIEETI